MKHTFSILYYINRSRIERGGHTTVICRITACGSQATFSTQLKITPTSWSQTRQRVRGHTPQTLEANRLLDLLRQRLESLYLNRLAEGSAPSAHTLRYDLMTTIHPQNRGLVALFDEEMSHIAHRVGCDKSCSTYNKYRCVRNHLSVFLAEQLGVGEIDISRLTPALFSDFVGYLRQKGCSNNTIWVYLMPLRKLMRQAQERGYIAHWRRSDYAFGFQPRRRTYLSADQLARLESYTPQNQTEAHVVELFILGCYTGLAYIDLKNLKREDISILHDGALAITTLRHKTHTPLHIRLLPKAAKVIRSHLAHPTPSNQPFLPLPSNRTCNRTLHTIALRLGFTTHLTFHLARHTFATTITLEQGVPIESVSRLLGHSSIKTTQIYATVTNRKLDEDMQRLEAVMTHQNKQLNHNNTPRQNKN